MSKALMMCGHVENSKVIRDGEEKPCCVICTEFRVKKEDIEDELKGRMAECNHCDATVPSKSTLPFFKYNPELETDNYYCGCFGWN